MRTAIFLALVSWAVAGRMHHAEEGGSFRFSGAQGSTSTATRIVWTRNGQVCVEYRPGERVGASPCDPRVSSFSPADFSFTLTALTTGDSGTYCLRLGSQHALCQNLTVHGRCSDKAAGCAQCAALDPKLGCVWCGSTCIHRELCRQEQQHCSLPHVPAASWRHVAAVARVIWPLFGWVAVLLALALLSSCCGWTVYMFRTLQACGGRPAERAAGTQMKTTLETSKCDSTTQSGCRTSMC
ncbi:uncharacterized protein [Lepisosteus oculatus]|uniref:uncharacterized protein n=1 Tax=Lepisosteus oculatus TaxID=7918 RepID=UPI003723310A